MEITALSQKGHSLSERIDPDDADKIFDKLEEVRERWEKLCQVCNERQQKLEEALLELGQFSIAVEELLTWIQQTKAVLSEREVPPKEKKLIEVELAKLKVRKNFMSSASVVCQQQTFLSLAHSIFASLLFIAYRNKLRRAVKFISYLGKNDMNL